MLRLRAILAIVLGVAVIPAVAFAAAGVNIAWDDCRGGSGLTSKAFSCDTNSGNHVLVVSVRAPEGVNQWVAFESEIILVTTATSLPDWWRLRNQTGQINQCRNGALSASSLALGLTGCLDAYLGSGSGGIGTYQVAPQGDVTRSRLLLVFAVPLEQMHELIPNEEYFVAKVVISNIRTVGSPNCAGCGTGACIAVANVKVVQPAGAPGGDVSVNSPDVSNLAFWQNAYIGHPCDPACHDPGKPANTNCAICPTVNATWGRVKAIYR